MKNMSSQLHSTPFACDFAPVQKVHPDMRDHYEGRPHDLEKAGGVETLGPWRCFAEGLGFVLHG